jgi:hypothetical protein
VGKIGKTLDPNEKDVEWAPYPVRNAEENRNISHLPSPQSFPMYKINS